ncbi:MAG: hypothetical protein L0211_02595 [Planctomycetaceae bacterium]|nr:hypothetical protein [Planctomycetaceae bacterium]
MNCQITSNCCRASPPKIVVALVVRPSAESLGIRVVREAELLEHFGPLLGPAFLRVERDDAPSDEIFAGKQLVLGRRLGRSRQANRQGQKAREE